jgi:hypothetical protein
MTAFAATLPMQPLLEFIIVLVLNDNVFWSLYEVMWYEPNSKSYIILINPLNCLKYLWRKGLRVTHESVLPSPRIHGYPFFVLKRLR